MRAVFAALALTGAAWAQASAFAPVEAPAPVPKPPALDRPAEDFPLGQWSEVSLRAATLNLERARFHLNLRLVGAATLSSPHERFGGLSALIWEQGRGLSAISDRGWSVTGLPQGVSPSQKPTPVRLSPLLDEYGQKLRSLASDAEGAALDPRGGWLVSFEGEHRIWRYPHPGATALRVRGAAAWAGLQSNSGLEAIATAPDGAIYAIPERSGAEERPFPVWRRRDERWETLFLPRTGDYLVTDAAIGPDGRLYVLERSLSLLGGFGMRIRRADPEGARPGATLTPELVAELPAGSGVDNMEGMAFLPPDPMEPGEGGEREARLLVISDDNFRFFQRTLMIEFRLAY